MTAVLALLAKVPIWAWALLIALGVIGWQHVEVSHYRAQATSAKAAVVAVKAANAANLATIVALKAANDRWARDNAANLADAKVYTDAAMAFAKKQQAEADAAKAKLRASYERQPDAKAWADARVPDSVVRVLTSAGQD